MSILELPSLKLCCNVVVREGVFSFSSLDVFLEHRFVPYLGICVFVAICCGGIKGRVFLKKNINFFLVNARFGVCIQATGCLL